MYEALCGHPPFTGETFPEILRQHVLSDPEPLPDTVPPALADFVMCMLAKQPEDRPDNAAAAIEALRAAAEGVRRERPARTPTFHPAVASELGVSSPTPTPTPTPRPAPRRAASSVEVHGLAAVRFEPRDGASVAFRPPTLISRRSGGLGLLAGLGVLAAILVAWVAVSAANPASLAAVIDVPSIATMPTPTPPAVEPADDTPQAGTTLAQAEVPQVDVPEPEPPLDPTPAPTTSSPTGPSSSSPRPRGSKVPDPRWIGPKPTQMPDPIEPKPPKTADPKPKPPASDPKPDPSSRVLTTDRPPRTPTKASKLPGITESSSAPARVQRPSS
jgi:serine/threonine-protein kinase